MTDPLTEVIFILQPRPAAMKLVLGDGAWCVRREVTERVECGLALEGSFRFQAGGQAEIIILRNNDRLVARVPSTTCFEIRAMRAM